VARDGAFTSPSADGVGCGGRLQARERVRMSRALNILFVLVACVAANGTWASMLKPGMEPESAASLLVTGDYLRGDYIMALRKTRSPIQSEACGAPQLIQVRKRKTGLSLQVVINFHEGGPTFVVGKDRSVIVRSSAEMDVSNAKLSIVDGHHFKFGYGKNRADIYTFVRDASAYVAGEVLVGTYTDDKGRSYAFGKDGWAIFPHRKFRYAVGVDHVLNHYDYYEDETSPVKTVYAFKRLDGLLQIFRTQGEMGQVVDERPTVVLHETNLRRTLRSNE